MISIRFNYYRCNHEYNLFTDYLHIENIANDRDIFFGKTNFSIVTITVGSAWSKFHIIWQQGRHDIPRLGGGYDFENCHRKKITKIFRKVQKKKMKFYGRVFFPTVSRLYRQISDFPTDSERPCLTVAIAPKLKMI